MPNQKQKTSPTGVLLTSRSKQYHLLYSQLHCSTSCSRLLGYQLNLIWTHLLKFTSISLSISMNKFDACVEFTNRWYLLLYLFSFVRLGKNDCVNSPNQLYVDNLRCASQLCKDTGNNKVGVKQTSKSIK